ncbi:MAG: hypothetical protein HY000_05740 [Planctomycetes bacterium]|nr:hypothetical protein [Planctomycetota bacterium]
MGEWLVETLEVVGLQVVGVMFLLAGFVKALDPPGTLAAIEAYRILHLPARTLAAVLPWLELLVAGSLITGLAVLPGTLAAVVLLVIFTGVQIVALLRGQEVPCGCFGSASGHIVTWRKVGTNALLVATCVGVLVLRLSGVPEGAGRLSATAVLVMRTGVSLVTIHVLSLTQIAENFRLQRSMPATAQTGSPLGMEGRPA